MINSDRIDSCEHARATTSSILIPKYGRRDRSFIEFNKGYESIANHYARFDENKVVMESMRSSRVFAKFSLSTCGKMMSIALAIVGTSSEWCFVR